MIKVILFIIWLLLFGHVFAEKSPIFFRHLNISNGLPSNNNRTLFQDSNGFIWISSENKLVRYDGTDIQVFSYNSESGNFTEIFCFAEDWNKNLIFGTDVGVFIYGSNNQEIHPLHITRERLLVSDVVFFERELWIFTLNKGVYILSDIKENFSKYTITHKENFGSKEFDFTHSGFFVNKKSSILCTNAGLYKKQNDSLIFIKTIGKIIINKVKQYNDSILLLNSPEKGVILYNYFTDNVTYMKLLPQLNRFNEIYTSISDKHGNVWAGNSYGLLQWKFPNFSLSYYNKHNTSGNFSSDKIFDLIIDNHGIMWIATSNNGVFCSDIYQNSIFTYRFENIIHKSNDIITINTLNNNQLVIGTKNELKIASIINNKLIIDANTTNNHNIVTTHIYGKELICGTSEGVEFYGTDGKKRKEINLKRPVFAIASQPESGMNFDA
ncbi:MAG: two-component regulator propeller domain-containing protein, partial [Bacteroidales bacterium]